MIAVIRSELYRLTTIRSTGLAIVAFSAAGMLFSLLSTDFWALLAGVGSFGLGVVGVTQHFQHRTAVQLFLARPRRLRVLFAQLLTALIVGFVFTAVSGGVVLLQGDRERYLITLLVTPLMAVFGAAAAAIARNAIVLFVGFVAWILFVEAMYGKLQQPLPFSAYLEAATGDVTELLTLLGWVMAAIVGAGFAVRRDLTGD